MDDKLKTTPRHSMALRVSRGCRPLPRRSLLQSDAPSDARPLRPPPDPGAGGADIGRAAPDILGLIANARYWLDAIEQAVRADHADQSAGDENVRIPPRKPEPGAPVVDVATHSIHYRGRTCPLGNSIRFHLFARLARDPGHDVSYSDLEDGVWGRRISTPAIQSMTSTLRSDLRSAGMGDLADAIVGKSREHLKLCPVWRSRRPERKSPVTQNRREK